MKRKKIHSEEIKNIISELKDNLIHGINVTVPFKKVVIPYMSQLSPEAESTLSLIHI